MPLKRLSLLLFVQLTVLSSLLSQTGEQLRANLYAQNADNTFSLSDGNLTLYAFDNSNAIDGLDAVKMNNFGENFGLLRGASTLVVELRQSIKTSDTIFFKMWNMHKKNYTINLNLTGLAQPGLTGVLEDKYLKTSTLLDLNGLSTTAFAVTGDPGSAQADRFRIIFLSDAFTALPVTFASITASAYNQGVKVKWSVENEKNVSHYQVEKSIDGQHFFTAATIYLNGKSLINYTWTDNSMSTGKTFYRLCSFDMDAQKKYSDIAFASSANQNTDLLLYPNPVTNGRINIKMTNQPEGIYQARLIDAKGGTAMSLQVQHKGTVGTQTIQIPGQTGKGMFMLEIISPQNILITRKIIIR